MQSKQPQKRKKRRPHSRLRYGPRLTLHAVAPYGWGTLTEPDGYGRARSADGVASMEIFLRLAPDASRIRTARFRAEGSPILRAAGSAMMQLLPGLRILEARHVMPSHLESLLGPFPELRRPLLLIALRALRKALKQAARRAYDRETEDHSAPRAANC